MEDARPVSYPLKILRRNTLDKTLKNQNNGSGLATGVDNFDEDEETRLPSTRFIKGLPYTCELGCCQFLYPKKEDSNLENTLIH